MIYLMQAMLNFIFNFRGVTHKQFSSTIPYFVKNIGMPLLITAIAFIHLSHGSPMYFTDGCVNYLL